MAEIVSSVLSALPTSIMAAGLAFTIILFYILESSRWLLLPLFLQYTFIGILLGKSIYVLLAPVWCIVGLCVTGLFAISGSLAQLRPSGTHVPNSGIGLPFDGLVLVLGAMIAYGIWSVIPATGVLPAVSLAFYWLISSGMLLLLQRRRALYALGAVSLFNGVLGLYLHTETSLLVLAFAGLLAILVGYAASTLPQRASGEDQ